jgi:release factor glutamine methyltransferase
VSDSEPWTVLKVLRWTQGRFGERGLATPRLDAEVLLAHVLGGDRVSLYTHFDQPLAEAELSRYRELIRRRLAGEPVAYLVGKREFRSLELTVDARVLVPRPETETLVDVVLARLGPEAARVVDVGTGSGAIALAIKSARPLDDVHAVDLSDDALAVARDNAARLGIEVTFHAGDLLAPVAALAPLDGVVSNPPYIPSGELPALPIEVRREPARALDGGRDGLEIIRRLAAAARPLLAPRGLFALEVGAGQAGSVADLLGDAGYSEIEKTKDLQGIERVVSARLRPESG